MKEYSLRHNRSARPSKKPLLLVVLVALALTLLLVLFSAPIRQSLHLVMRPLWLGNQAASAAVGAVPEALTSKAALREALASAKERLLQADVALRRYGIIEAENRNLKALLGRQVYHETVLAAVLARPAVTPYDTLIIDAGAGLVEVGDRVVVEGSIVIGTISAVHERTAQVLLFSAPGVETQVQIGPERIPVTARGQGAGSFVAEFPRDAHVEDGYSVVLPGINPFVFATVESTEAAASDPFITVRFKNPLNIQALQWVQVLTDPKELPPAPERSVPEHATSTGAEGEIGEPEQVM